MSRLRTEIHSEFFSCVPPFSLAFSLIFLAPLAMPAPSTSGPILQCEPGLHSKLHGAEPVTGPILANQRWTQRLASRKKCAKKEVSQETKRCQAARPMESDCRRAPTAQTVNEPGLVVTAWGSALSPCHDAFSPVPFHMQQFANSLKQIFKVRIAEAMISAIQQHP